MTDLSAGACAGLADETYRDRDPFHPEINRGPTPKDLYAEAEAICARCQIRDICLADALTETVQWGYRAGMTPEQRQALKSKPGRPVSRCNPTGQELEMRAALHAQGLSDPQIARLVGVSGKTVTTWRNRNGLPPNVPAAVKHSPAQNIIKKQAYDSGCTDKQIAELVGVQVNAIKKWRGRHNLPVNSNYRTPPGKPAREKVSA